MSATPKACVIGHPVGHSRSPMLHEYWLKQLGLRGSYEKVDVAPERLATFFAEFRRSYVGANVTVPHKAQAAKYLTRQEAAARAIGAVNTIWIEGEDLVGGNTDAYGFLANLDERAPGWDVAGGRALLIGAGGAARAAIYGLLGRRMSVVLFNRTRERAEDLAAHFGREVCVVDADQMSHRLREADRLVNATSLGMTGRPPLKISLQPLKRSAVVCDVVYTPLETELLQNAAARGHRAVDGLGMLIHQGIMGFSKWFGRTPVITRELRAMLEADIRASSPPEIAVAPHGAAPRR